MADRVASQRRSPRRAGAGSVILIFDEVTVLRNDTSRAMNPGFRDESLSTTTV